MDVGYYESELDELQQDIAKLIMSLRKTKGRDKDKLVEEIKDKITKAEKTLKAMKRAAKNADDKGTKEKLDSVRKRHAEQIKDLSTKLEMAKEQSDRSELLGDKKEKKSKSKGKRDGDGSDSEDEAGYKKKKKKGQVTAAADETDLGNELFKEIFQTQEDSLRILERMINKADESQALAEESMEMLKIQGEQITRIDAKMDELGSAITRGGRELKSLMRKLATEKLIMLIIALIAIGILGLIAWGLVNRYCKACRFAKKNNNIKTNSLVEDVVSLLFDQAIAL